MIDDFKKLFESNVLLTLDKTIMPRLLSLAYWTGLAALVLLAINHLFASFALGFGAGLWGLLEILVFTLLGFFALRLALELCSLHFAAHGFAKETKPAHDHQPNLVEEVRGAIEDLAKDDAAQTELVTTPAKPAKKPATVAKATAATPKASPVKKPAAKRPGRTAKRSATKRPSTTPKPPTE